MPGVLSQNLHSGFLNEEYGIYLLRQLAAVAPVGRAEDHGIDAVATLLPATGNMLHPSSSFLIQFKSESVKHLKYVGREAGGHIPWLEGLQLPFFFGSVSRIEGGNPGKLRIHTSQELFRMLFLDKKLAEISICFWEADKRPSEEEIQAELDRINQMIEGEYDGDPNELQASELTEFYKNFGPQTFWLEEPIVEFGLTEVQDSGFRSLLIAVLDEWVRLTQQNILSAPLGIYQPIKWTTNEMPEYWGDRDNLSSPGDDSKSQLIWNACRIPLEALLRERLHNGSEDEFELLAQVLEILRNQGVSVSPQSRIDFIREWGKRLKEGR